MSEVKREILERLRKAKAEGKTLPPLAEKMLKEAEAAEGPGAPRIRIIAALYLLGASLSQLANAFNVKRQTVWSYVKDELPHTLRIAAGEQRQMRRRQPALGAIMETADLQAYQEEFNKRRKEFRDMDAVRIAAALKTAVTLPSDRTDSLSVVEPGDPYA